MLLKSQFQVRFTTPRSPRRSMSRRACSTPPGPFTYSLPRLILSRSITAPSGAGFSHTPIMIANCFITMPAPIHATLATGKSAPTQVDQGAPRKWMFIGIQASKFNLLIKLKWNATIFKSNQEINSYFTTFASSQLRLHLRSIASIPTKDPGLTINGPSICTPRSIYPIWIAAGG